MRMPLLGRGTDHAAGATPAPDAGMPAGSIWRRRIGRSAAAIAFAAALAAGGGFVWFVGRVPTNEVALDRNADAIVALTGGASRVADALELLAAKRGRRLLISGLNRSTTVTEIARLNPEFARDVRCCVDIDRALNTFGNAVQIKRWAESQGFRSLIVVTSNYHMPRALAEIAHQLPQVALIPYPVVTDRQRLEHWWSSGIAARLMLTEYVKYVVAKLRMGLKPAAGADEVSSIAQGGVQP
jgi:uncharacterized SAM-binding protein YcdF (DUF218 family)